MKTGFIIIKNTLPKGLHLLNDTYINNSIDIGAKVGLQLLNWIANGSSRSAVVPPIKLGILRGSGSVFVGTELVGVSEDPSNGQGTPNTSYSGRNFPNVITVGYNTAYASYVHEGLPPAGNLNLGEQSLISGDVQGQFITAHLMADGKASTKFYATLLKKVLG
jgi:hypothetical protein